MAWPSKNPADYRAPGRYTIPLEGDRPQGAPARIRVPSYLGGCAVGWGLARILGADNALALATFPGVSAAWVADVIHRRRQSAPDGS